MTNYLEKIEGRHYTGPWLVDPELDDWFLVTNLRGKQKVLNGKIECNPKRGLIRRYSDKFMPATRLIDGYVHTQLTTGGKPYALRIHVIVATVVYGYKPNGLNQVNHKDFDKANCSASNLEWCDNTYNLWYNQKRPQPYYLYDVSSLTKIKEFPNRFTLLTYYNIKEIHTFTIDYMISRYSGRKWGTSMYGVIVTTHDYGDSLSLPFEKDKNRNTKKAVALYNKQTGETIIFKTLGSCAAYLGVQSPYMSKWLKKGKTTIQMLRMYSIQSITCKEYYDFYDKHFNDTTISFYDQSFNNVAPRRYISYDKLDSNYELSEWCTLSAELIKIGTIPSSQAEEFKQMLVALSSLNIEAA